MAFDKVATRKNAKLRLALSGTAGSGKTYTALQLAGYFGKKIGVMDSERGSASLYAGAPGIPEFFVEELEEKNLQEYTAKIREAAAAGVDVLVIDSYSHAWLGALDAVDKMGGQKFTTGWKVISPKVTALVDLILSYPGHVIATMRSKSDYVLETNAQGKSVPKKVGLAAVAREGTDYEFGVMFDLTPEGSITVSKTRCSALADGVFTREDVPKIAKTLQTWLSSGAPVESTFFDQMVKLIEYAGTQEHLDALIPKLKELGPDDLLKLRPIYKARKVALAEAAELEGLE